MIKKLIPLFIIFFSSTLCASEIRFLADEWCPFNCSEDGPRRGYIIEIAERIFSENGLTVNYKTVNWARAIKDTRNGIADAIVGAYISEAPDLIYSNVTLGISQACFYTLKDSTWSYGGVQSLDKKIVGIINSYSYGEELDRYFREAKGKSIIHGESPLVRGLMMLKQRRLDTMIEDRVVFGHTIKETFSGSGPFRNGGCSSVKEGLYIGFSQKNPKSHAYVKMLDEGIERLRKSGELAIILDKYDIKDWID